MSRKIPKKRWDNPDAFPTKELYFNLLSERHNEDEEIQYEFRFLTTEEAAEQKEGIVWYKTKNILQYPNQGALSSYILDNNWAGNRLIVNNLMTLYERLKVNELINYFYLVYDKSYWPETFSLDMPEVQKAIKLALRHGLYSAKQIASELMKGYGYVSRLTDWLKDNQIISGEKDPYTLRIKTLNEPPVTKKPRF